MTNIKAYRGSILHFLRIPRDNKDRSSYQYFADGLLVIEDGKVKLLDAFDEAKAQIEDSVEIIDYSGKLIMPGFLDTHLHYAQTEMIASYGEQLLEWLQGYVFPAEGKYGDREYAKQTATFFLEELLRNGTTTAAIYSTVHKAAADVLFECAEKLNMRIITGKTMMDRNAPDYLLDNPQSAYDDSKALYEKWHGKARLSYAITPRFAPTSTEAQLEVTSALFKEFPDAYMQTHISENKAEVEWVKELFPNCKDYTDVYDHYGLLGKKSIFGHAIYLDDSEFKRFTETDSVISWCPTSNFFLGSGLFKLEKAKEFNTRFGIGTDMGGGSSFSMLRTLNEAYKVAAVQGLRFSPLESLYYITLGNAASLSLDDKIGNFESGKEADFLIIDLDSTPLLENKMARAKTLEDKLFNLCILGDDRAISATYVMGKKQHEKK